MYTREKKHTRACRLQLHPVIDTYITGAAHERLQHISGGIQIVLKSRDGKCKKYRKAIGKIGSHVSILHC